MRDAVPPRKTHYRDEAGTGRRNRTRRAEEGRQGPHRRRAQEARRPAPRRPAPRYPDQPHHPGPHQADCDGRRHRRSPTPSRPTRPANSSPHAPKRTDDGSPVMVDCIAPRSQRVDVAARVETLVRAHPHARGPDHPCRVSGSRPRPSSWPRPWARPPGTGAQPASHIRPGPGHTPLRLIDPRRARLPHRQQETRTRHVPVRLRLPDRSRLPYLLPAQTGPGQAPWARPCSPWPTAASSPCTP